VEIIVYTGAIMTLFLFVLMLVGVEHVDSMRETLAGHRVLSLLVAVLFGVVAVIGVAQSITGSPVGLVQGARGAGAGGNVEGLSALLFGPYVMAFELTSALLITAALAAMVLAHRERLTPRSTQATLSRQRLRDYAETGRHPGNPPTPGVLASSNAVDVPALLPDGSPVKDSIAPSITARAEEGSDD
jgi:NADH-quinone oxidoreductase subunit J